MDDFIERRKSDLAGRTADTLRKLADDVNVETVGRELHRIVGTSGSYGLMDGSRGAAELLARVHDGLVTNLADELNTLADVFARSIDGEDH